MSLYGSRDMMVEKIWIPIPGEGRQVPVKIILSVTAKPDEPVVGIFRARFNETEYTDETQKGLKQKLRSAAAAASNTVWRQFLEAEIEFPGRFMSRKESIENAGTPFLAEVGRAGLIKPDVRTRRRNYGLSDGEFSASTGLISKRDAQDYRVYLPDTPAVRKRLATIQRAMNRDIEKRRAELKLLEKLCKGIVAPTFVEPPVRLVSRKKR